MAPSILENALSLLPHGSEFRFVDRLINLEPGLEGTGEYRVRGDEYFLRAHFPTQPIFPGVLLVEAVAQLAGVVAQSSPRDPVLSGLKLSALRAVKISGTARPGEIIRLEARITGRLGLLIQAEARAFVDERLILKAELTLSGDAFQKPLAPLDAR